MNIINRKICQTVITSTCIIALHLRTIYSFPTRGIISSTVLPRRVVSSLYSNSRCVSTVSTTALSLLPHNSSSRPSTTFWIPKWRHFHSFKEMEPFQQQENVNAPRRSSRRGMKSKVSDNQEETDPTSSKSDIRVVKKEKVVPKRSSKLQKVKVTNEEECTLVVQEEQVTIEPKKRTVKKKDIPVADASDVSETSERATPKKKRVKDSNPKAPATKETKRAKVEPQRITERDELNRLWDAEEALKKNGSYTFRVMSWNVAGLRALLRKQPDTLSDLAIRHNIDVLCLQETKLQDDHVTDPKLKLKGHVLEEQGYDSYWSCSTAKKGYSGTAVFIKRRAFSSDSPGNGDVDESKSANTNKKKQATLGTFFQSTKNKPPCIAEESNVSVSISLSSLGEINPKSLIPLQVTSSMGKKDHDSEGRIITMDFPLFTLANVYVPNSGQNLERLSYRTQEWDKDLLEYMQRKEQERGLPVIWLGDLNVAHKAYDCWNDGAKHLEKQAGTTKEERESFQMQLDAAGGAYIDAFRHLYPDAKGHYTYWSQRAGNRQPNKGLRLDYFICSKRLFEDTQDNLVVVRDTYMIPEQEGSDHCPVVLELEIKKH